MGHLSRLDHASVVLPTGEGSEGLAKDVLRLFDYAPGSVAFYDRRVVLLLARDRIVEDLRQPGGQSLRIAHAARFRNQDGLHGHEIPDPVREREDRRLALASLHDMLESPLRSFVEAAEHDEVHRGRGPQEQGDGFLEVAASQPSAHQEHDREMAVVEL